MNILTFSPMHGVFKLDGVDIGDYIEAEFLTNLGCVEILKGPHAPLRVFGYEMMLTFSANNWPPRLVQFRTGSKVSRQLMLDRKEGELLCMRPAPIKFKEHLYFQLVVNGERIGLTGRVKA